MLLVILSEQGHFKEVLSQASKFILDFDPMVWR